MWFYLVLGAGVLVVFVLVVVLYYVFKRLRINDPGVECPYSVKFFLLPKADRIVYEILRGYAEERGMVVFPRVRLTDFLWTPRQNRNAFLNIQNKFVDFLLVDSDKLRPVAAVFLRDSSIRSKVASEELIRTACNSAGLTFIEFEREESREGIIEGLDIHLGGGERGGRQGTS